ncbi:hypothetical protein THOE12_150063 [Vibrio rotiferianus]|nr:hypothetical protein THOE12_150063 [Vibrio rotiferianus]
MYRGVITFDSALKVQVSLAASGGVLVERLIWDYENKQICLPRGASTYPSEKTSE